MLETRFGLASGDLFGLLAADFLTAVTGFLLAGDLEATGDLALPTLFALEGDAKGFVGESIG